MYLNLYAARFPIQPNNFSVIINSFVRYPVTMNLLPTFLCRIMSLLCMMQSRRLNIKNSLHYRGRLQSVNNKRTMQNRRRMISPLGKLPFLRFRSLWVCTEQKANVISTDSALIIFFWWKCKYTYHSHSYNCVSGFTHMVISSWPQQTLKILKTPSSVMQSHKSLKRVYNFCMISRIPVIHRFGNSCLPPQTGFWLLVCRNA